MHFEGEFIVNLPREKVWEYISDPHSALDYVPNIQELKVQNPDRFTANVGVGVGSIKGNFNLEFEMVENVPPNHTRIKARGSPGLTVPISSSRAGPSVNGVVGLVTVNSAFRNCPQPSIPRN